MTTSDIEYERVVNDPGLPQMRWALDRSVAEQEISQVCADTLGSSRIGVRAMRVVRHKPGRRCLVEYDLDVDGQHTTIIGKMRARGLDHHVVALMHALRAVGFDDASADGVSVPQPLGASAALGMHFQCKVAGESLASYLTRPSGPMLVRRAAAAVAKLHRAPVPIRRAHSRADEWAIADRLLGELARQCPGLSKDVERLRRAVEQIAAEIPATEPAGIHRDFYAEQVQVAGDRMYLLDLDLVSRGDAAIDAGNFVGNLWERALRMPVHADQLLNCAEEFEADFVALGGGGCRFSLRAFAHLSLARHVALSVRFPDRQAHTQEMLSHCLTRFARWGLCKRRRRRNSTGGIEQ